MAAEKLSLIEPCEDLKTTYLEYIEEVRAVKDKYIPCYLEYNKEDFPALIKRLQDASQGIGLPAGYVPASSYWLVDGKRKLLGIVNLRHSLNPHLLYEGGHIGYSVRPSERNKGYATLLLKLVLEKAKELGIMRALVTCDQDNQASIRVIQKNGGILENEVISKETGKLKQRYWIDL